MTSATLPSEVDFPPKASTRHFKDFLRHRFTSVFSTEGFLFPLPGIRRGRHQEGLTADFATGGSKVEETVVLRAIDSPASVKEVFVTRVFSELLIKMPHFGIACQAFFPAPPIFFARTFRKQEKHSPSVLSK